MTHSITSQDNIHFKRWKSLCEKKGIKKHQQFIASGRKILSELISQSTSHCELLIFNSDDAPSDFPGKIYILSKELFKILDEFGTHSPLLVSRLPAWPTWSQNLSPSNGLNIICPLGDPANLGALLRTATAFNVASVILTKESAHPLLPKSLRASSGAALKAPIQWGPSLKEILDLPLDNAFALDMEGKNISTVSWPKSAFLIVGEEGPGLPEHFFNKITIPISKDVDSLNALVATSIAIWSYKSSTFFTVS
ncbi:MAG: RNA methyltransferase [Bdellovibrionaceae bacterium]|nr:RNA methyltransferase [Pseudobdellovibrionaceae bacterium]